MAAIQLKPTRNILVASAIALLIFIGGAFLLHAVPVTAKDKIANGLLADFVVTIPALYYFIIIRPLKVPVRSLLLVLTGCCLVAYVVLPQQQRDYILQIRKLTSVAELLFIIYLVTKFNKISAAYKTHQLNFADPVFNLRAAMADILGNTLPIKIIASELAMLRYGLLFWKSEKPLASGTTSFTTHRESGYVAVLCILLVAVLVEVVAVHLLLMRWSHIAANIVTILTAYSIIFLIADLAAIINRRVLINGEQVILRTGLRWRVTTTVGNIQSAIKIKGEHQPAGNCFKGGVLKSSCNLLITFQEPVKVDKLYGASKQYASVLMSIDDFEGFAGLLNETDKPRTAVVV